MRPWVQTTEDTGSQGDARRGQPLQTLGRGRGLASPVWSKAVSCIELPSERARQHLKKHKRLAGDPSMSCPLEEVEIVTEKPLSPSKRAPDDRK